MFCINCGEKNSDNNKFCSKCGYSLAKGQAIHSVKVSKASLTKNSNEIKLEKQKRIVIALIISIIVVTSIGVVLALDSMTSKEYILNQVYKALEEKDVDNIKKYIDTDFSMEQIKGLIENDYSNRIIKKYIEKERLIRKGNKFIFFPKYLVSLRTEEIGKFVAEKYMEILELLFSSEEIINEDNEYMDILKGLFNSGGITDINDKYVDSNEAIISKSKINRQELDNTLKNISRYRNYSLYIEELNSGEVYTNISENEMHTKRLSLGYVYIPILVAIAENLNLQEVVEYKNNIYTIEEIAIDMLENSSNEAANKLLDLLGGGEHAFSLINIDLATIGCYETHIGRYLGDADSLEDNYTSIDDMVRILKFVYSDKSNVREILLSVKSNNSLDAIASAVKDDNNYRVYSQYGIAPKDYRGYVYNVYNNSAVIVSNNSPEKYLVVIMSEGKDENIPDAFNAINEIIDVIIKSEI